MPKMAPKMPGCRSFFLEVDGFLSSFSSTADREERRVLRTIFRVGARGRVVRSELGTRVEALLK